MSRAIGEEFHSKDKYFTKQLNEIAGKLEMHNTEKERRENAQLVSFVELFDL